MTPDDRPAIVSLMALNNGRQPSRRERSCKPLAIESPHHTSRGRVDRAPHVRVPESDLNQDGTSCSWFRPDSGTAREDVRAIIEVLTAARWSYTFESRARYARHLQSSGHTSEEIRGIWNECHEGWVNSPPRMFATRLRRLCPNPNARQSTGMIPIAEAIRRVLR